MPEIDIQESLTRKIGPLPAWGWGLVVVGTFFVVKLFRGSGPPQQTETATIVGGEGVSTDIPSDVAFSGPGSLVTNLVTSVGALTSWQTLQTKLTTLLDQKDAALLYRSQLRDDHLPYWTAALNNPNSVQYAVTDEQKAYAQAALNWISSELATNKTVLDDLNVKITEVQQAGSTT